MRTIAIAVVLLTVTAGASSAKPRNIFVSDDLGISMEVPFSRSDSPENQQIAVFCLPMKDGFAANVNLQKQAYSDSLAAFDKLSVSQFKQFKVTILKRDLKANEVRYEYSGDMQGRTMHWYARAVKTGDTVFLITATGLDNQWQKQKQALMASVDSFKLLGN